MQLSSVKIGLQVFEISDLNHHTRQQSQHKEHRVEEPLFPRTSASLRRLYPVRDSYVRSAIPQTDCNLLSTTFQHIFLLTYDQSWASAFRNLVRYRSIPIPDWVSLLRYRTGFPYSGTGLVPASAVFFPSGTRMIRCRKVWRSAIKCTNADKETPCTSTQLAVRR
jgi:hypothetical protein